MSKDSVSAEPVTERSGPDGIDQMRQRMERGRRAVPAPRRPVTAGNLPASSSPAVTVVSTAEPSRPSVPPASGLIDDVELTARPATAPLVADEPQANLAVRVRRSLDLRLDDLLHELRHRGVRSSKAELMEMLLWELPPKLDASLEARLVRFRAVAPRR